MKLKLMLAALALAGLAAALALAAPTRAGDGTGTTGTTTTSTGEHHGKGDDGDKQHGKSSCKHVELKGSNASGSVAFTVTKSNKSGSSLVGRQVTLTIPAGSSLNANACIDATGALTLRGLEVRTPHAPPTTTSTTGTTTTTK